MRFVAAIVEWFKDLGRDSSPEWKAPPAPPASPAVPAGSTADGSYLGGGYEDVDPGKPNVVFVDDEHKGDPVDPLASTAKIKLPSSPKLPPEMEELWSKLPVAYQAVLIERARQDERFGVSDHDPMLWMTILGEEVGELCQAVMHTRYGGPKGGPAHMRAEAVQVAAVAIAMIQALDRGVWKWGSHVP